MTASVLALALLIAGEPAADVAVPTDDNFDAFPVSGTTLGTNSRLLVSGGDHFLVTHGDGSVEEFNVGDDVAAYMNTRRYFELRPSLVAGETITLERVCANCGPVGTLSWTVGADVDDDAPVFSDGDAADAGIVGLYDNDPDPLSQRYGFNVSVWLPPLVDDEAVYVHIVGDGVDTTAGTIVRSSDPRVWTSFAVDGRDERTACFDAIAIDAAANESAPFNFCVELVDDRSGFPGCSQTGASTFGVFAALGVLVRRRRR